MVRLEAVGLSYRGPRAAGHTLGHTLGYTLGHKPERAAATDVLRDVSFHVGAGQFRWLVGPSGAGKTSLLRLLYLATQPSRGRLVVMGAEIGHVGRAALPALRRRIGVVFQNFRLLPHLSTFDNVALPLRLAGRPEGAIRVDVSEMLAWVGLSERSRFRPGELSGGEQQRAAIARAVVIRPELLLADEPTGNLDDFQAERVIRMLVELNRLGTTVIVATHSDALVARHPGRILELKAGRLVHDGPPADQRAALTSTGLAP